MELMIGTCHDWVCGRGAPGSPEAKRLTCTICGQNIAGVSGFDNAAPCKPDIIPVSWLPLRAQKRVNNG